VRGGRTCELHEAYEGCFHKQQACFEEVPNEPKFEKKIYIYISDLSQMPKDDDPLETPYTIEI
jgi:hypothetical protein